MDSAIIFSVGDISAGGSPLVELWLSGLKNSLLAFELFENEELLVVSGELIGVSEEHFAVS